jgi:hypothetical protein
MAALCRFCRVETYLGDAHPCCVYWDDLEPGLPCPACKESRKFWAGRRRQAKAA